LLLVLVRLPLPVRSASLFALPFLVVVFILLFLFFFFFFTDTATTEIYTLSLHDALPIWKATAPACCTAPIRRSIVRRVIACSIPDRKSTRLNSSHQIISYAVFCLKKKKKHI